MFLNNVLCVVLFVFLMNGCDDVSKQYYKKDCIVHVDFTWSSALTEDVKEKNTRLLARKIIKIKYNHSIDYRGDWYFIFTKKCNKKFEISEEFFKKETKIFNNFKYKIDKNTILPSNNKTIDVRGEFWKDGMVYYP